MWVYRKRGRFFKYLTFTHTPENENDYEKLRYNIDPDDKSDCYVKFVLDIIWATVKVVLSFAFTVLIFPFKILKSLFAK